MSLIRRTLSNRGRQSIGSNKATTRRPDGPSCRNSRAKSLRIEPLEDRRLLSVGPVDYPQCPQADTLVEGPAAPALVATDALQASPMISASAAADTAYTPQQVRQAYGIDSILVGSLVGDGTGQTIAIITAWDNPKLVSSTDTNYATSDLAVFNQQFGLADFGVAGSPSFTKIAQDGTTNYPTAAPISTDPANPGWGTESAMDVEWAHAIAPKANIVLVEARSTTSTDLIAAVNTARSLVDVSVVSMSLGWSEAGLTAADEAAMDATFTTPAGHRGITFLAATGDKGSAEPSYPALSPNVLAVGGTSLTIDGGGDYASETAWSGSGGGESAYEAKPSYQTGVPNSTHRQVPDVSLLADPATGVAIYDSYDFDPAEAWRIAGGTSLSTPCWAGMIAIANQIRAAQNRGSLDGVSQTLPLLYKLPSTDFHDITTGSNGAYSAGVGYDMVTGLGTPIANLLVPELALTAPTVTINQKDNQSDPTNSATINFTVVFSETVTGFTKEDVVLSGTAGNLTVDTVTPVGTDGTTYTVAVKGMTNSGGTVIATVRLGAATDTLGNTSEASTSTDNVVTFDNVKPKVATITKAASQADPTKDSPINFTVVFDEDVVGFTTGDVVISGSGGVGAVIGTVTGSGKTYNVAVTGMSTGEVIITVPTGVAQDLAGNFNEASTSATVSYDSTAPAVTINQATGQVDPASASTIAFTVVFSEAVTGFDKNDVTLTSSVGDTLTATVTGSGTTYTVTVAGMTHDGNVTATIAAGAAQDALGNSSSASTSTDNVVRFATYPTATLSLADGQPATTDVSPIVFNVVFSEAVADFAAADVTVGGTAIGTPAQTTVIVTPVGVDGKTYRVEISGMIKTGTVTANILAGAVHDAAENAGLASNTVSVSYTSSLTATVSRAGNQATPTGASPIVFIVEFSAPVTDFADGDVTLSGSAAPTTAHVTPLDGDGMIYRVEVSGMSHSGDVIVGLAPGVAHDSAQHPNSQSNTAQVSFDNAHPTVTVTEVADQDPTRNSTVYFTVEFSEPVTGFDNSNGDVILSGSAGATTAIIIGSGTTYTVAVSGMTQDGGVTLTVPAGIAHDAVGHPNDAFLNVSDSNTVIYDTTSPTATINQSAAQLDDPTAGGTIVFRVVFSEPVADFATGDVALSGTAGATTAVVTQVDTLGTIYNVAVSGMVTDGTVIANINAGAASDAAGNPTLAATFTDNVVTYYTIPTVTINQAADQVDPAPKGSVKFTVVFSEPMIDFSSDDVTLGGTAGATTKTITSQSADGLTYTITVSGMTQDGTVIATIAAGTVHDQAGNANTASTSTDNAIFCDVTSPTVTIDRAVGQDNSTGVSPVKFLVTFSEAVTGFSASDITLSGTAGATTPVVTPVGSSGKSYEVSVSGMTAEGTVDIAVATGAARDTAGNTSLAPTITDNSIDYFIPPSVTINQKSDQSDPTDSSSISFTVVFSEKVTGFSADDVTLSGTAGATTKTVTPVDNSDGKEYTVVVGGFAHYGTVIAQVAAAAAVDEQGHPSLASTSSDNTVTYKQLPTVAISAADGQADPTHDKPIHFKVVFSDAVTDFTADDVTLSGTAPGTLTKTITGSGTTYDVAVTGMTGDGTVVASIEAKKAHDADGDPNNASNSLTVTYDAVPTVTIKRADNQTGAISSSPINFTVTFSEAVTGFAAGDVKLSGTANAATAVVTPVGSDGTTYNVAVSGMTGDGTVIATIDAGVATDSTGNANTAATLSVTYATLPAVTIDLAPNQTNPTNDTTIDFTVVFSEAVTDFTAGDVTLGGTAGATAALITSASSDGRTYNVAVSGMVRTGTVVASVAAGAAHDAAGNSNSASTSSTTDTVDYHVGTLITGVTVTEASAPKNGILESSDRLKLTWTATSQSIITAQIVVVDGKSVWRFGGYGGPKFSCPMGTFSPGTHTYAIKAVDAKRESFTATGTFTVAKPVPPAIVNPAVVEAAKPKNGQLESNENLRLTWTASSENGIASHIVRVDGRLIAAKINRPQAANNYNCVIGTLPVGTHRYSIKSIDARGVGATVTGTFTVVRPIPPAIANALIVNASDPQQGLNPDETLALSWTASSQHAIASQVVKVDGKRIARAVSSTGGADYRCIIGQFATGTHHTYSIRSTDAKGVSSTFSGAFDVIDPALVATLQMSEAGTINLLGSLSQGGLGTLTFMDFPVYPGVDLNGGTISIGSNTVVQGSSSTLNLSGPGMLVENAGTLFGGNAETSTFNSGWLSSNGNVLLGPQDSPVTLGLAPDVHVELLTAVMDEIVNPQI